MSVAPDVVHAVADVLRDRHRINAISGSRLAAEVAARLARPIHPRRVGEAVERLIEHGSAICSTSADGYWTAETPEQLEESLAEVERRARMTLRRRRMLRRALAEMRGQVALSEVA